MTTTIEPSRFPDELRRWRGSRRWSQMELADREGTTQRHLSYMEQGRSKPGRVIVVRLAESLELSLRERNDLLLAAGYAPIFAESALDAAALRPVRDALQRILEGHLPYPAVVVRPYGELVVANEALDIITAGAAPELLEPPVNVLRLALHPDRRHARRAGARSVPPRRRSQHGHPPARPPRPHRGFAVATRERGRNRRLLVVAAAGLVADTRRHAGAPARLRELCDAAASRCDQRNDLHVRVHVLQGLRGGRARQRVPELRRRILPATDPPGVPAGGVPAEHRRGAQAGRRARAPG